MKNKIIRSEYALGKKFLCLHRQKLVTTIKSLIAVLSESNIIKIK